MEMKFGKIYFSFKEHKDFEDYNLLNIIINSG